MEFTAKIIQALGVERGISKASGKEWSKGTVIVEIGEGQYARKVALTAFRGADEFGNLPIGREYKFSVNLESREFNGRWYTSVECWKWEAVGGEAPQPATPPEAQPKEDLPF